MAAMKPVDKDEPLADMLGKAARLVDVDERVVVLESSMSEGVVVELLGRDVAELREEDAAPVELARLLLVLDGLADAAVLAVLREGDPEREDEVSTAADARERLEATIVAEDPFEVEAAITGGMLDCMFDIRGPDVTAEIDGAMVAVPPILVKPVGPPTMDTYVPISGFAPALTQGHVKPGMLAPE